MSSIDQLLSRALLIKGPHVPADVVSSHASYGRGRCACACEGSDDYAYGYACTPASTQPAKADDSVTDNAATDLQVLCETVVNRTATTSLTDLVTERLPAPRGARVVGCILQLTDDQDSARRWWQYAAGAGDDPAGYLLYLYHLSRGETAVADWWLHQTGIDPHAPADTVLVPEGIRHTSTWAIDTDLATILRILSRLVDPDAPPRRTELVSTVMDYVASAVAAGCATNPEVQIPLPPNFAEHLNLILATADPAVGAPKRATRRRVLIGEWLNKARR